MARVGGDELRRGEWAQDYEGRNYRTEGRVRVFQEQASRDAVVEDEYRLSASAELFLCEDGKPENMNTAIMAQATVLVEAFLQSMRGKPGTISDKFKGWCVEMFGRELEPSARGVLRFEIGRRLGFGDGGHAGPSVGIFRDAQEENEWARAAQGVTSGGMEERLSAICRSMGVTVGEALKPFPRRRFMSNDSKNTREQELREQAEEILQ